MTRTMNARDMRHPQGRRQTAGGRTHSLRARAFSAEVRTGSVHFQLQRTAGGLYVEREDIPRRGLRTIQSVAFPEPASFGRWCDTDPLRFEHPLLHTRLKRAGAELWGAGHESDAA